MNIEIHDALQHIEPTQAADMWEVSPGLALELERIEKLIPTPAFPLTPSPSEVCVAVVFHHLSVEHQRELNALAADYWGD